MIQPLEKRVIVNFNLLVPGHRSDEHPSFQHYFDSLGDVPTVGDYVLMTTWNQQRQQYSRKAVKVVARRIAFAPEPKGDRYEPEDDLTTFVTLLVDAAAEMPDFRG